MEVRTSAALHDRFYLPDTGDVVGLGVSLNGLERNVTTLAAMSGEPASVLRRHFEDLWRASVVVSGAPSPVDHLGGREVEDPTSNR